MFKPFRCNKCSKGFNSTEAAAMHITDKHKGNAKILKSQKSLPDDDEPSYADRAIEAQLAIACGEHTDDAWLLP